MKVIETAKFQKLRKKVKESSEKEELKRAILEIRKKPETGKKLKGEFALLRSFKYSVVGQPRRLIYKWEENIIILFSFGPREGIYKK